MRIKVVNIIPASMSSETERDAEPSITVNPSDPKQIAISAFTPGSSPTGPAPIFVSTDGGDSWSLIEMLPGGSITNDTSLRFAPTSGILYAGIIRSDPGRTDELNILATPDFLTAGSMSQLAYRLKDDQPWVEAGGPTDPARPGDHIYVTSCDRSGTPTATVDQTADASAAGFVSPSLATRYSIGSAAPTRTAVHPDGTVYLAFVEIVDQPTNTAVEANVVLMRDDKRGFSAHPYHALLDPGDQKPGYRVQANLAFAVVKKGTAFPVLGNQRTNPGVAIAVDPRNSDVGYVAWVEGLNGPTSTIRLFRFDTGGTTWLADRRIISSAINPCLAVNVHGTVGLMYQQYTAGRWSTHLEISEDGLAHVWTDHVLADVPDALGSYPVAGENPIGDYANLVAVGKDFYGAFSAYNEPIDTNFPNHVQYQRAADWVHYKWLTNGYNWPVANSIDPFFVHYLSVAEEDDFYVRDWTDSPTSGDPGDEPSTHAIFWETSDVWNRRSGQPGTFPNGQPENEDAGNGSGFIGVNFAMARVRRKTGVGSPAATVTAHFLVAQVGIGMNFVDAQSLNHLALNAPDPTIAFAAGDAGPYNTPALRWDLPATTSTNVALAVEISTNLDPFVAPSLVGNAPAWPTFSQLIVNDNNKAVRSMGVSTTFPWELLDPTENYTGIVHNPSTYPQDVVVQIDVPHDQIGRTRKAKAGVAGRRMKAIKPGAKIVLKGMEPGEHRWIELSLPTGAGKPGEEIVVHFSEIVAGKPVSGFGIGARIGTVEQAVRAKLERHRSVFTRLAAGFDVSGAEQQSSLAAELSAKKRLTTEEYAAFLRAQTAMIDVSLSKFLAGRAPRDPFGTSKALKIFTRAAGGKKWEAFAIAHSNLLNKLDALLTSLQLALGDPADILQNVRWQLDLYRLRPALRDLPFAEDLRQMSRGFMKAFSAREARAKDFPALIEKMLPHFRRTAESFPKLALAGPIAEMSARRGDLAGLQKAHREFLLVLDRAGRAKNGSRRSALGARPRRR